MLLIHADKEPFAPYVDTLATRELEAVRDARRKAHLLLIEERVIVEEVAYGVVLALSAACCTVMSTKH